MSGRFLLDTNIIIALFNREVTVQEHIDIVDLHEPEDWVTEYGDDGERYAYPLSLNHSGFFEDFFDAKAEAVTTFWRVIN